MRIAANNIFDITKKRNAVSTKISNFIGNFKALKSPSDKVEKSMEFINQVYIHSKEKFSKPKPESVKIFKTNLAKNTERYSMINSKNETIGEIDLFIEGKNIFISNLESYARKKYKGIGSKLVQIAEEKCIKSGGIITLNAQKLHTFQKDPTEFYIKKGFTIKAAQESIDKQICGTEMTLNPHQKPQILEYIKQNPILKTK